MTLSSIPLTKISSEQSEAFLYELTDFINTTQAEQKLQCSPHLPTVEQYIHRRIGSGAVKVCFALTEFCYGVEVRPATNFYPSLSLFSGDYLSIKVIGGTLTIKMLGRSIC